MSNFFLEEKSYKFSVKIINLYKNLIKTNKEYILSKQLIRSATSIGANIAESRHAASRLDFINKLKISLKEAEETKYWLRLLTETNYIPSEDSKILIDDCLELIKILVSSINSLQIKND